MNSDPLLYAPAILPDNTLQVISIQQIESRPLIDEIEPADFMLIGDASDANNIKRIFVSNLPFADRTLPIAKNYLKNGNFQVIQGTGTGTIANSTALPTPSLGYLGETEWCIAAAGGTPAYAFSAANESVTFSGAASTSAIYLLQRLESRDMVTLANLLARVTFSAEISNSLLTSVIWEAFRPATASDTHGTISAPTQTLIASGTFTVSSTLTRYSASFDLPALAARGLEIRLRVGAQTSGTWVVSRLKLEEGSVATDFNCGDYSQELFKARRYFYAAPLYVGQTGLYLTTHTFPNQMFQTPVSIGGGSGYTATMLNREAIAHFQSTNAIQAFTFSSHIP